MVRHKLELDECGIRVARLLRDGGAVPLPERGPSRPFVAREADGTDPRLVSQHNRRNEIFPLLPAQSVESPQQIRRVCGANVNDDGEFREERANRFDAGCTGVDDPDIGAPGEIAWLARHPTRHQHAEPAQPTVERESDHRRHRVDGADQDHRGAAEIVEPLLR
ncbi:hypothetical protein IU494_13690 [Nocardia terpenica]|uniref:hypothetical protein n=1 Tax=Nocardia terpenica TaxID=455432 RepID=UPI001895306B|nr:hypothetical protein [Nocardia terpenica]MBF6061423.1 hypothetical protein [Nocardia terpenica]MBF6119312.1 hypothetical protein [Nocardia terpenica]